MASFKKFKEVKTLFKNCIIFFIPALRFLLGSYIRISDSKYINSFFLKMYCAIFSICLTLSQFYNVKVFSIGHISIIEYIVSVIFSLITSQDYLITFYKHLRTSDTIIGFKNLPLIKFNFLLSILFIFFVRIVVLFARLTQGIIVLIVALNALTDTNPVIISFVLSSLYARMVKIRERFESNFIPINIVGKEQVKKNVRVVRKCLGYYNNLLDGMYRIDRTLQFLVFIYLIFSFPRCVGGLQYTIKLWLKGTNLDIAMLMILEVITTIAILSIPGIVTEMIKNEIDRIKSVLVMQIIRCSDQSLRFELETALQHIHRRPFSFTLLNAVPIDINLPIGLTSLCITYVIIFTQFRHFTN